MWGCGGYFFVPSRQNLAQLNSVFQKKARLPPQKHKKTRGAGNKKPESRARERKRGPTTHIKNINKPFLICAREKKAENKRDSLPQRYYWLLKKRALRSDFFSVFERTRTRTVILAPPRCFCFCFLCLPRRKQAKSGAYAPSAPTPPRNVLCSL